MATKREWKNVTQHLSQYRSPQTKKTYRTGILAFFKFLGLEKDLDENSVKYLKSHKQNELESDIVRFRDSIENKPAKTQQIYLTSLFVFLSSNDITFKQNWRKNIIGKDDSAVSEEHVPTPQELQKLLNQMPLIGKAMTLCLCSSGLRIGELIQLRESDIELDHNPVIVKPRSRTTKTKKNRITFISQEAKSMLLEWLQYRDEWVKLFEKRTGKKVVDPSRVFPTSERAFREIWNGSTDRTKLNKKDETTHWLELRIHTTRKFFRTYGLWKVPDIAEAFLGHLGDLEAIYTRFSQAQLEEAYLEAEPNLTITTAPVNIKELTHKVEERYQGIDKVIAELYIKNTELEKKDSNGASKIAELEKRLQDQFWELEQQRVMLNNLNDIVSNYFNEDFNELVKKAKKVGKEDAQL